jgi:hypothetical protein
LGSTKGKEWLAIAMELFFAIAVVFHVGIICNGYTVFVNLFAIIHCFAIGTNE